MGSKAAQYNKRREQGHDEGDGHTLTTADIMHDMALWFVNHVAKTPLAARPFWSGYRTRNDDPRPLPESATQERKEEIIEARQTHAAAADDKEWVSTLAIAQRYGVKLSEIPAR